MEAVHKTKNRIWIDNVILNVKKFKEQWISSTSNFLDPEVGKSMLLKDMVSAEEYAEIENICGPESMICEFQDRLEISREVVIPDGVKLQTLKLQAEDVKKRRENKQYAMQCYNNRKYRRFPRVKNMGPIKDLNCIPFESVQVPEVVLTVQLLVPEKKVDRNNTINKTKIPSFQLDLEFLVLGEQYLTELRDVIDCVTDKAAPGDFSDCPDLRNYSTSKDLYKSGFFYINGVFYNDFRDKDCRDYSDVIIKWSEQTNRKIGPFTKAQMENTKFSDLDIQLGYPYVYVHQGDCEHLLNFSDIKMFSKDDNQNKNAYPLYVHMRSPKRLLCLICHLFQSTWVVHDSPRLIDNPSFLCEICFKNYNYDENNQKIGKFVACRYPDNSRIK